MKAYLWIFMVVANFILFTVSSGFARDPVQNADPREGAQADQGDTSPRSGDEIKSQAAILTPNDFLSNNLANPDLDTWRVRCGGTSNTTICADIFDDTFDDNTFHVTTVCVDPAFRRGFGEKEQAVASGTNPSATACVSNCREAIVSFDCEFNDFCDSQYNSVIECVNRPFQILQERQ